MDIEILLNEVDLEENTKLGPDFILTSAGMSHALKLFKDMISARAEKAAAKKIVTIITEDDQIKVRYT